MRYEWIGAERFPPDEITKQATPYKVNAPKSGEFRVIADRVASVVSSRTSPTLGVSARRFHPH